MRRSPARNSLFAPLAFALVAVGLPHPTVAGEPSPADIFGVDVGTPGDQVKSLVAALSCREFAQPTSAIACRGGLGESARFSLHSTTYWVADGRVARIFAVSRLSCRTYAECMEAYEGRAARVAAQLGQVPSQADGQPSWMQSMDDKAKLDELAGGRLAFRTIWRLPERDLTVRLHADRGVPVLVVGLEARPSAHCAPDKVAAMLMDLFPPATPVARSAAARGLGECRVGSAAGALAAVARQTSEKAVKTAAQRALGAIGPMGAVHLGAIAEDVTQGEAAAMAKALLPQPAEKALVPSEPPAVAKRVTALPVDAGPPKPPAAPTASVAAASVPAPATAPPPAPPVGTVTILPPTPAPAPTSTQPPANSMAAAAPPTQPNEPPAPEPPPEPKGPPDGTVLALATSLVAGGVWGGGLSLLAQQDSRSVLFVIGSAGAVIGGGTAWGLTHFGVRPSPSQALWFANSTAWGTLAGLTAWAASGSESSKLKWGLLVGGESVGMAMGVFGARRWDWTPAQILFANSLVFGAGLAGGGGRMLVHPGEDFRITPLVGYGTVPAMAASAIFSRYARVTGNDLHLLAASATASAWSSGLLAYGIDADSATRDYRLVGGALLGMGAGYVGAAALSQFVEVAPRRTWLSGVGMLAGNLIGAGSHMMLVPDDGTRRPLWAGVGGLGLGATAFALYPRLRLGHQAATMSLVGGAYGAATWGLAMASSANGSETRAQGGALALGTAGAVAGLVASGAFEPGLASYPVALGSAALGATAGIGVGKLATDTTGAGEMVGTLAGSALGLAAGATFTHYAQLRGPDLGAAALGGGYGALAGALASSLGEEEWGGWQRKNQGGLLLGLPAGVFAGAALSHLTGAVGADVAVASVGSALGLGMGLGTGLLWPENYSRPARIGAVAGITSGLAGALLLERPLGLRAGLGEAWPGMAAVGAGLGIVEGVLLAGLAAPSGQVTRISDEQMAGGLLLGGSAGLASGLVLSKYFAPGAEELAVTGGGAVLGGLLGRGLAMMTTSSLNRGDTVGSMAGMVAGTTGLALAERYSPLDGTDFAAAGAGLAFGGLAGALSPTLADAEWGGWLRRTEGSLLLGLGSGALAGAALRHATAATPATVVVASSGGLLGLGMGVGSGLLWPESYSRPARIGAVAGLGGGMLGALLLEHPLRLDEGPGPSAAGLAATGAGLGIAQGILLAALIDPTGEVGSTSSRQLAGGALLGGSAGLASGLVLSRYFQPGPAELSVTAGGAVLGGLFGRGLVMVASESDGRRDTAGTMAGAFAGATGLALVEHFSPLGGTDAFAGALGLAYGGFVGALAPTLADPSWGGWRHSTEGGLLLGVGGGALAAAGLAHGTGAGARTLGLGLAGALDGVLTGAGIGLLANQNPESSQGVRIGVVAGASSGLLLGLGFWPRLDFSAENLAFVSAVSAVGGWTGGWVQVLGHASLDDVEQKKIAGGVLAGAGGVSMVATALLPALHVDTDLIANALLTDAIFTGAGAGVGALASRRADAPVWGMLGAGTAGLLLGGVLHESIDFERGTGLLAFGATQGLWAGAWLPYVLRPSAEVTDLDHVAGVAAGGLGGVGLSLVASTVVTPRAASLGMAGVGSAIGASLAGGSVLLADDMHDQRGVGIMLGGTAAGLGLGGLLSRWAPLDGRRGLYLLGGASFGLAEGLAFGWAGRASTGSAYAGSALIGAGLGASLGLASSANASGLDTQEALVASGFSAWGGWVGSFGGALANRDPHEVVLGGLAAANLGFVAGYGALRYDLVTPRDFGWLSLAGAMGTALGGGVGAIFSSRSDPRPVLAGLAAGPVVGIGAGALIVPYLRHRTMTTYLRPARVAGVRFDLTPASEGKARTSADVLAERKPSRILAGLKLVGRQLFDVTNWTPFFGSLPPPPGDPNPAPFFMGLSGGLR